MTAPTRCALTIRKNIRGDYGVYGLRRMEWRGWAGPVARGRGVVSYWSDSATIYDEPVRVRLSKLSTQDCGLTYSRAVIRRGPDTFKIPLYTCPVDLDDVAVSRAGQG